VRNTLIGLVVLLTACGSGSGRAVGDGESSGGTNGGSSANGGSANPSGGSFAGGAGGAAAGNTSSGGTVSSGGTTPDGGAGNAGGSGGSVIDNDIPITGEPGIWENVTPDGIDLSPSYNPADSFGVQDVLADPVNPGTFYAFVCYQGVWKTTDYGTSWAKVDTDGDLEQGRPWGEAIAPDGSYMLACTGYGTARWGAWKSTDGGVTWEKYEIVDNSDPYMFDIDKNDKDHVLSTSHSVGNVYESTDAGETWADKGDAGVGHSGYVFFITSTTWLMVAQSGGGGTRRTTNSGASWSDVGDMEHVHGGEQIYVDPTSGYIYVPSHSSLSGIYRSTDGGASFAQVSNAQSAAVFATGNTIYSLDSGATTGTNNPIPHTSGRDDGASFQAMEVPGGMTNGTKRADATFDANTGRWAVISGNWNAGIWRYIEE
jgi:hypothetical protein